MVKKNILYSQFIVVMIEKLISHKKKMGYIY